MNVRVPVLSVVLCGASVAACVKVPAFQQQDAGAGSADDGGPGDSGMPPGTYIQVVPSGAGNAGATVTGPSYTLEFSDTGLHFPHQLVIGGQYLMGGGETCGDESGMGIAVYPLILANGEPEPDTVPESLTIDLAGPVVGKVTVPWGANFDCSGTGGAITGTSQFTFFPDGRVMRFDRVHNETAVAAASSCTDCTSTTATSFYVTSFMTLQATNATLSGASLASLMSHQQQVTRDEAPICLSERGQQVAMAWREGAVRVRVADGSPRTLAFVYDWLAGSGQLPTFDYFTNTVMRFASGGSCSTLMTGLADYTADRGITLSMTSSQTYALAAALDDGIYSDSNVATPLSGSLPFTLEATSADIPPGFAVWVDLGTSISDFTFEHSASPAGTWYAFQNVGSTQVVFWFWTGLAVGETITVGVP